MWFILFETKTRQQLKKLHFLYLDQSKSDSTSLIGIIIGLLVALGLIVLIVFILVKKGLIKKEFPFRKLRTENKLEETAYSVRSESLSIKSSSFLNPNYN